MATRAEQLQQLAGALPVANKQIADQMAAGRAVQMQQAVAAAPMQAGAAPSKAAVQGASAQQATAAGADATKMAQTAAGQQQQVNALGIQAQGQEFQQKLGQQQSLSSQRIHDQTMAQAKTALQQNTDNELAKIAWMTQNSKDANAFAKLKQQAGQAHERNQQMNKMIYDQILTAIDQENAKGEQKKDQAHKEYLYKLKQFYEQKAAADKAAAANKNSAWAAGGTIIGTVAGAYFSGGNPAAAGAGGAAGGAAGTYMASKTS